jgi:hypothetical protein
LTNQKNPRQSLTSNKQQATSNKQQATSNKQQAMYTFLSVVLFVPFSRFLTTRLHAHLAVQDLSFSPS